MKQKKTETAHAHEDEAGHSANQQREPHKGIQRNPTTDNKANHNKREQRPVVSWEASGFSKLVREQDFRAAVQDACAKLLGRFHVSPDLYACKEFEHDVIIKFGKWFPYFRGESSLKTAINTVAHNQLVDKFRDPENKAPHYEDLQFEDEDGEKRDEEDIEGGDFAERYEKTKRNRVAERANNRILVKELKSTLTRKELSLYTMHYDDDRSKADIAKELGVSRQYVTKLLNQIVEKMRASMDPKASRRGSRTAYRVKKGRPARRVESRQAPKSRA